MIIAAYGEWWDPHIVDWGRRGPGLGGRLAGLMEDGTPTNAWDQRGIYVLFQDWEVVYVGKTGERPLGARLRAHRKDDVAGRWDRFSWYGIRHINQTGDLRAIPGPARRIQASEAIATLEALLIRVTAPSLNRRRESVPAAKFIVQDTEQAPLDIRGHLSAIDRKVDSLSDAVAQLRLSLADQNRRTD
jgi:hypothetical protein